MTFKSLLVDLSTFFTSGFVRLPILHSLQESLYPLSSDCLQSFYIPQFSTLPSTISTTFKKESSLVTVPSPSFWRCFWPLVDPYHSHWNDIQHISQWWRIWVGWEEPCYCVLPTPSGCRPANVAYDLRHIALQYLCQTGSSGCERRQWERNVYWRIPRLGRLLLRFSQQLSHCKSSFIFQRLNLITMSFVSLWQQLFGAHLQINALLTFLPEHS